jgi:hypothetical protein
LKHDINKQAVWTVSVLQSIVVAIGDPAGDIGTGTMPIATIA